MDMLIRSTVARFKLFDFTGTTRHVIYPSSCRAAGGWKKHFAYAHSSCYPLHYMRLVPISHLVYLA